MRPDVFQSFPMNIARSVTGPQILIWSLDLDLLSMTALSGTFELMVAMFVLEV